MLRSRWSRRWWFLHGLGAEDGGGGESELADLVANTGVCVGETCREVEEQLKGVNLGVGEMGVEGGDGIGGGIGIEMWSDADHEVNMNTPRARRQRDCVESGREA
jgi:hypothetical protein